MSPNDWVGQTLGGRYRLEGLLGQGGMSSVYKAYDPNLRRAVAVKLVHSHLSNNPEFIRRFEEEAAAVAQLRHPNIIQVYDFNHDENGTYYMVLEYVAGETLQARLKRLAGSPEMDGRLPLAEAVKYGINLCEAVDYAHQRSMVHRDIKPANIMLDVHDQAILMDFGIAKILGSQQHTATGAVIGTALYMSPEQIRSEGVDHRSDIYSIGVTLFEMVGGRPPFESDSAMTLMMMHLNDPVPDLRRLQPGTPEPMVKIIERALAKNREWRYQSAAEMAQDLRGVLEWLRSQVGATDMNRTMQQAATAAYAAATLPAGSQARGGTAPLVQGGATGGLPAAPQSGGASGPVSAPGTGPQPVPASNRRLLVTGGVALGLAVVAFLIVSSIFLAFLAGRGRNQAARSLSASQTAAQAVALQATTAVPTATLTPAATAAGQELSAQPNPVLPTDTPPPMPTHTPAAVSSAPAVPTGSPYFALIVKISADQAGTYFVEYETVGFIENMNSRHIHFYFSNGQPGGSGPAQDAVVMYGGPRPFSGLTIYDRPADAVQLCAAVANRDHTQLPDSGNCVDLPVIDLATPLPGQATPANSKPDKDAPDY